MMAARRLDTDPAAFFHAPVMLAEVVQALSGIEGVLVDGTLGGAGHASALLKALPGVRLFAIRARWRWRACDSRSSGNARS